MPRPPGVQPHPQREPGPRRVRGLRHPVQALRTVAGDGPTDALLVLFALNAVDELDRTGFAILLPTIRDHFAMSDTGILSLVALTALGAMLLQLPIAILADRGNRVRLARLGGVVWGVFSFATGLSAAVWMLVLVRAGGGIGHGLLFSPAGAGAAYPPPSAFTSNTSLWNARSACSATAWRDARALSSAASTCSRLASP